MEDAGMWSVPAFVTNIWQLSAQDNMGIPAELLEAKKKEVVQKRVRCIHF